MNQEITVIKSEECSRIEVLRSVDLNEYTAEQAMINSGRLGAPITIYRKKGDNSGRKYTTMYYKKLMNTAYALVGERISSEIDFDCFKPSVSVRIGKLESMMELTKRTIKGGGEVKLFHEDTFLLNKVIAFMFAIPGFKDAYEQYYLSPDDGVADEGMVKDGASEFDLYMHTLNMDDIPQNTPYTKAEFQCIAFVLVIFMNKKVVNSTQYAAVMEKRIQAFCIANGLSSINIANFVKLFSEREIKDLSDRMAFYPKLRIQINLAILSGESALSSHIKTILRDSQLTIFNFIHIFLTSPKKTKLHIVHIVLKETRIWLGVYKKLTEMYGSNWRYFKLLEPTNSLTSLTDIPHLACAALSFIAIHYDPSHTAVKIVGKIQPSNLYKNMACQLMPERLLQGGAVGSMDFSNLNDDFTSAGLEMGYSLQEAIDAKDWNQIDLETEAIKPLLI